MPVDPQPIPDPSPSPGTHIVQVREIRYCRPERDPVTAVVLELLPGILIQTFGIGNLYAGNIVGGVLMMLGYWILQIINLILCFLLIGLITFPLTWLAFMIFCPLAANSAAKRSRPVQVENWP